MTNESEIKRLLDLHTKTGDERYLVQAHKLLDVKEFIEMKSKQIRSGNV